MNGISLPRPVLRHRPVSAVPAAIYLVRFVLTLFYPYATRVWFAMKQLVVLVNYHIWNHVPVIPWINAPILIFARILPVSVPLTPAAAQEIWEFAIPAVIAPLRLVAPDYVLITALLIGVWTGRFATCLRISAIS